VHPDFVEGDARARGVQRRILLNRIGRLELMKVARAIAPTEIVRGTQQPSKRASG
jgi:hypothetical protein